MPVSDTGSPLPRDYAAIFAENPADDAASDDSMDGVEDPTDPRSGRDNYHPGRHKHRDRTRPATFDKPRLMERPHVAFPPRSPLPAEPAPSPKRPDLSKVSPPTRKRDRDMFTAKLGPYER